MIKIFENIRSAWYSLTGGIENIIYWWKVIWKDSTFDESYLFKILHRKLEQMEYEFAHEFASELVCKADTIAKQIMIAKCLCKRIIANDYLHNALVPVEKKYGQLKWKFESNKDKTASRLVFEENSQAQKARYKAYKQSDYSEKNDIDYLFNHMAKYVQTWWY